MLGGGQFIISSTPKQAGDTFHKLWEAAKAGSRFVPVEAKWQEYMQPSVYLQWVKSISMEALRTELKA